MAGCGVDGMTILGVLGEAAKLSDAERRAVIRGVLAAAGDLPVCVGVTHAGHGPGDRLRPRGGRGRRPLGDARAARPRPPERRRGPRPLPRGRGAVDLPVVVQDHPASSGVTCRSACSRPSPSGRPTCRVVKLEDEPSPPKIGRLLAARPDLRILGGLGAIMLLEELRRGAVGTMTGFGFPELLVEIVGRYRAGDEAGARETFHRIMPLIRFENQPGINLAIRKHLYQRRGAIATERLRAPGASLDAGHDRRPRARPRERRAWRIGCAPPADRAAATYGSARIIPPSTGTIAPGDVRRRRRQQERPDPTELERVAVAPERDPLDRPALDLLDRDAAGRRPRRIELGDPVRGEPARREAVDPDRGDLLDQRLDQPGQARAG